MERVSKSFIGFFFSALVCLFIAFLSAWGNPSWFDDLPLASAYRFMNGLLAYSLSCFSYFCLRFFLSPGRSRKLGFFILSFTPSLGFAGLTFARADLRTSDLFVGIFFAVAWSVVGISALFSLARRQKEDTLRRVWAIGMIVCAAWLLAAEAGMRFFQMPAIVLYAVLLLICVVTALIGFVRVPSRAPAAAPFRISEREWQVVSLLLEGKTNQEIADLLFISLSTVKTHLKNIFEKTGTRNRMEVARVLRPVDHPKV